MTDQEEILHERFDLIQDFADKRRLKVSKIHGGERIITGRLGDSHLYQYSLTELGVAFVPEKWTPKTWGNHKRAAIALGMTLRQNGDSEGTLSFDPAGLRARWLFEYLRLGQNGFSAQKERRQGRQGLQRPVWHDWQVRTLLRMLKIHTKTGL